MKKILLIYDREAFLERNRSLLERAGFHTLTAASAEEAIQVYREQPVDLVVSKLDMPQMGGDTLCSLIRQGSERRNVPFILICYQTDTELERASQSCADAYVTKPVRPEKLLEQVGKFLTIPPRRDYRVAFNAIVSGTRETMSFSGVTHNISASGILCETTTHLNQDDLITNLLLTVGSHNIVADGRVVRSESRPDGLFNYGVRFTTLPTESREKIEEFVAAPIESWQPY